jgi:single-strand DNA-binding protein
MAQGFQLEGKIHLVNDIQTFSSGFTKREFVVETIDGQYPQMIKFECVKEKTALVEGLNRGDQITVHFDIRGNEYQGKYFVNLNCWKVDKMGGAPTAPKKANPEPYPTEAPAGYDENQEDIPF